MGPGIARYDGNAEWVGFHHKTLASFLQAFGDAGLALRSAREFVAPGGGILPWDLALLTEKPR